MDSSTPTRGQIERALSQRIQALYRNQLEHQPSRISCQIFDEKVAIILEDSITQPEQLLVNTGQEELAQEVRSEIDEALKPQIQSIIEEVVGVGVVDLLSNAKLDTGRTATVAILAETPKLRNMS
ncbi:MULTISPECIES: DUF2294 domain-containing protein [Chroococcaceae]|jgi:uncharacterized protein YbcI|uniref:Na+-translocating membrane potential-generating system MpsC domain-containing protein n=1 Tax=Chroogloeocystis siderophila 5.2 s.c.1 TaxID=247279 RepID=A0A1U7HV99_9CHRO|nr:DUF2294 domain-containing protein [Chroogloeocystis siderophila]OKH27489.1 hypothetical protein NIES1031_09445 [Chroogloeocystis siderophila 5.2 s.c.1]